MRFLTSAILSVTIVTVIALLGSPAHALFSTLDTGELTAPGSFKVGLEPQYVLGDDQGFNLNGRFDTGLNDSSSLRALIGTGHTTLESGLLFKWIPIPDVDMQPAIGGLTGLVITRLHDINTFHIRLHPLVSKSFDSIAGVITPYAALPTGISINQNGTTYPLQLALGAELKREDWNQFRVMVEGGTNISNAFSYISAALVMTFDDAPKTSKDSKKKSTL